MSKKINWPGGLNLQKYIVRYLLSNYTLYSTKIGVISGSSEVHVQGEEFENFINDYYPGAKAPPNEMVESMTSPNPSKGPIICLILSGQISI